MARSTTEQAVGAAIRGLRMRRGWSMGQLGAKLATPRTRQYVERVERGSIAPPISVYEQFARALEVELSDLLPARGSDPHPQD